MKLSKFVLGFCILISIFLIAIVVGFGGKFLIKEYVFPFKHKELIEKYSEENNLDPYFVLAVIKAESKFNADAKSHKDAYGLMQITEDTGKWVAGEMGLEDFSKDKLYDEEYNIKLGCWYLNNLSEEFNDTDLVIASYNAGRGRVKGWLVNKKYSSDGKELNYIPYKETEEYVEKVKNYYKIYKKLYD